MVRAASLRWHASRTTWRNCLWINGFLRRTDAKRRVIRYDAKRRNELHNPACGR